MLLADTDSLMYKIEAESVFEIFYKELTCLTLVIIKKVQNIAIL